MRAWITSQAAGGGPRGRNLAWQAFSRLALLLFAVAIAGLGQANAQEHYTAFKAKGSVEQITMAPSTTTAITLNVNYANLVVGNSEIVDAMPLTGHSLYLLAKNVGRTNVAVYDANKQLLGVIDVKVAADLSDLRAALRSALPRSAITVTQLNGKIQLSGHLPDAIALRTAIDIAKQFVSGEGDIVNAIRITDAQQVLLEVRFLEATRDASRELGVGFKGAKSSNPFYNGPNDVPYQAGVGQDYPGLNIGSTASAAPLLSGAAPFGLFIAQVLGGGLPVDVVVKALETKGLARRLAEPNLTALSGETASFNAGGEIPVPGRDENGNATTEFKKYGVQLNFTPTVLDDGVINLKLHPRVSDIDRSVLVNGVPGLTTRETETTLELRDGQSFAVSGLLQSNNLKNIEQLPYVGQIPVLGALFRSASYRKRESDLVVIVTAHLVRPAVPGEALHSPLDKTRPSNDVEFFLLGTMEVDKDTLNAFATGDGIRGPFGHIIDVPKARGAAVVAKK